MKILVTGNRGYIGGHLVSKLTMLDHELFFIDLKDGQDILDCELPEVDLVIHLAAQPGVMKSIEDPFETVRTNTLGTVRLGEKYKNTKFIFASTGGAIQDEIPSPYGLSKYCAEKFVEMLSNDYVILRFANVYGGEGSRSVVDTFLNSKEITIYGTGFQRRTFVHIDDLIRGIIQAMDWKKGSYYFGSDENYTILELAKATGKEIKFAPFRKGELLYSYLKNTTPDWRPTMSVIEYIHERA